MHSVHIGVLLVRSVVVFAASCWFSKEAQPGQLFWGLWCVGRWLVVLCPGLRLQEGVKAKSGPRRWTPSKQPGRQAVWLLAGGQTIKSRPGVHAKPLAQAKPWEWCGGYRQGVAFLLSWAGP